MEYIKMTFSAEVSPTESRDALLVYMDKNH